MRQRLLLSLPQRRSLPHGGEALLLASLLWKLALLRSALQQLSQALLQALSEGDRQHKSMQQRPGGRSDQAATLLLPVQLLLLLPRRTLLLLAALPAAEARMQTVKMMLMALPTAHPPRRRRRSGSGQVRSLMQALSLMLFLPVPPGGGRVLMAMPLQLLPLLAAGVAAGSLHTKAVRLNFLSCWVLGKGQRRRWIQRTWLQPVAQPQLGNPHSQSQTTTPVLHLVLVLVLALAWAQAQMRQ